MTTAKRHRYKSDEEEEEEEEEEEDEEDDEEEEVSKKKVIESKEKVIEKIDPNIITVKLQLGLFCAMYVKFMKIDKEIELRWLMINYFDNMGFMDYNQAMFIFNGACCKDTDTPLKLSMVDQDVIYVVFRGFNQGALSYSVYNEPLLHQIKLQFSDVGDRKHVSTCFVYKRQRLNDSVIASMLGMEDGDVIDAFNFDEHRSSLGILWNCPIAPPPATSKVNLDINKSGPRVNVTGTSCSQARPPETQQHSNPPVQQTTTPWPPSPCFHVPGGGPFS